MTWISRHDSTVYDRWITVMMTTQIRTVRRIKEYYPHLLED